MEYRTQDGIRFFVLPEEARCTYVKKHPDNMLICPKDGGDVCIPEECGYYHEYPKLSRGNVKRTKKKKGEKRKED